MSALVASGLTRRFGSFTAVDAVELRLAPGSLTALLGPNGAGKTTLLRMLAGVLPPTSGAVHLAGMDLWGNHGTEARRGLAWVPHNPSLYDSLTVREHLEVYASLFQVHDAPARVDEVMARLDMGGRSDQLVGDQSTGNRQKVAIGGAFLHDPAVMLLDEPMNGLDPYGIRSLRAMLQERAAAGAAVLVSSHLLALVDDVVTDVVVLVDGKVRWAGTRDAAHALGAGRTLEELFFHTTVREPV